MNDQERITELETLLKAVVEERDRLREFVKRIASSTCRCGGGVVCLAHEARALLNELEGDNARNPDGTPFDGCVGAPKTSREDSP